LERDSREGIKNCSVHTRGDASERTHTGRRPDRYGLLVGTPLGVGSDGVAVFTARYADAE
jgi:hypothetical protein